ncbi:hypothetical protein POM88_033673 [Heracleum sosnowskyi]|uniref:Uncharacterized protein n=1 Tax=Heracleum sosnowskyi TaxID=360622 RepID=A0AAD8HHY6_9APIA|nr:hypothetical protein POM88_033673 [Heracleum sosnowskyi]
MVEVLYRDDGDHMTNHVIGELINSRKCYDQVDVISLARGSLLSKETPRGSSLTSMAKTFCELHAFVRLVLLAFPKTVLGGAGHPPSNGVGPTDRERICLWPLGTSEPQCLAGAFSPTAASINVKYDYEAS